MKNILILLKPWLVQALLTLLDFLIKRIKEKNDIPYQDIRKLAKKIDELNQTMGQ